MAFLFGSAYAESNERGQIAINVYDSEITTNWVYFLFGALKNVFSRRFSASWAKVCRVTGTKQLFLSSLNLHTSYFALHAFLKYALFKAKNFIPTLFTNFQNSKPPRFHKREITTNWLYFLFGALKNVFSRRFSASWARVCRVTGTKQLFLSSLNLHTSYFALFFRIPNPHALISMSNNKCTHIHFDQ